MIKRPILLDGHSLREKTRLNPSSLSLTLNMEPCSTASMVLSKDEPEIIVNEWIHLYSAQGDAGIFYVVSIQTDYSTGNRTLNLEHVFGMLKQSIVFGTAGGMDGTHSVTASAAVRAILDFQKEKIWTVGSVGYTDAKAWSISDTNILNGLTTISGALEKPLWSFDLSTLPFKVYLRPRSTDVACEMRMSRAISTMTQTVDTSDMYTRIYPVGLNEIGISGVNNNLPYLERNADVYGIVEYTETEQSIQDATLLKSWAQAKLNDHCQPMVTMSISGVELSSMTGLAFDKLVPGTVCQIPLPKYGTTVKGYIQTVAWRDMIADENAVQVTVGNKRVNVASIIAKVHHKGGGGGGAKAVNKELQLYGTDISQTKQQITLEAWNIGQLQTQYASLIVRADRIESNVSVAQGNITTMASKIQQMAAKISLVVMENDQNEAVINTASLVMAINNGQSSVKIQADKIDLRGYVTASEFYATQAEIENLKSGITTASRLSATVINATSSLYVAGFRFTRQGITINGTTHYVLKQS